MIKKFRGVYAHPDSGWTATISNKYLGWFREHQDAVNARIAAEIEMTGSQYDVREIFVEDDIAHIPMHG